jgi:hypothetical protein
VQIVLGESFGEAVPCGTARGSGAGLLARDPDVSTDAQIKQNRINSLRSTGPRTDDGKRKASQNAYKHGLRAQRDQNTGEESLAFELRLQRWSSPDGANDMNEFLLHDNVSLSFEIECVKRSLIERKRSHVENADSTELTDVHELGCRLVHDRTGPTATYGTRRWDPKKKRASWQEEAVHPDHPGELVKKLCSSANGCLWLLEQWDSLRARFDSGGGFWVPSDKFKAVRLLGREPIDALDDRRVADVFAAAHALYRVGKPFDNLISDMGQAALNTFEARVTRLYRDLVGPDDPKRARQILIDLVDGNILQLEEKLAEHTENARNKAQRAIDHAGYDDTRAGQAIRGHWLKCRNSLERGKTAYLKHKEQQGPPPRAGAVGGRVEGWRTGRRFGCFGGSGGRCVRGAKDDHG